MKTLRRPSLCETKLKASVFEVYLLENRAVSILRDLFFRVYYVEFIAGSQMGSAEDIFLVLDIVAERLRRWTANPLGSPRVGSNPIDVVKSDIIRMEPMPIQHLFVSQQQP